MAARLTDRDAARKARLQSSLADAIHSIEGLTSEQRAYLASKASQKPVAICALGHILSQDCVSDKLANQILAVINDLLLAEIPEVVRQIATLRKHTLPTIFEPAEKRIFRYQVPSKQKDGAPVNVVYTSFLSTKAIQEAAMRINLDISAQKHYNLNAFVRQAPIYDWLCNQLEMAGVQNKFFLTIYSDETLCASFITGAKSYPLNIQIANVAGEACHFSVGEIGVDIAFYDSEMKLISTESLQEKNPDVIGQAELIGWHASINCLIESQPEARIKLKDANSRNVVAWSKGSSAFVLTNYLGDIPEIDVLLCTKTNSCKHCVLMNFASCAFMQPRLVSASSAFMRSAYALTHDTVSVWERAPSTAAGHRVTRPQHKDGKKHNVTQADAKFTAEALGHRADVNLYDMKVDVFTATDSDTPLTQVSGPAFQHLAAMDSVQHSGAEILHLNAIFKHSLDKIDLEIARLVSFHGSSAKNTGVEAALSICKQRMKLTSALDSNRLKRAFTTMRGILERCFDAYMDVAALRNTLPGFACLWRTLCRAAEEIIRLCHWCYEPVVRTTWLTPFADRSTFETVVILLQRAIAEFQDTFLLLFAHAEGFGIPKLHLLGHLPEVLVAYRSFKSHNANIAEASHKSGAKKAYHRTNKHSEDYKDQINTRRALNKNNNLGASLVDLVVPPRTSRETSSEDVTLVRGNYNFQRLVVKPAEITTNLRDQLLSHYVADWKQIEGDIMSLKLHPSSDDHCDAAIAVGSIVYVLTQDMFASRQLYYVVAIVSKLNDPELLLADSLLIAPLVPAVAAPAPSAADVRLRFEAQLVPTTIDLSACDAVTATNTIVTDKQPVINADGYISPTVLHMVNLVVLQESIKDESGSIQYDELIGTMTSGGGRTVAKQRVQRLSDLEAALFSGNTPAASWRHPPSNDLADVILCSMADSHVQRRRARAKLPKEANSPCDDDASVKTTPGNDSEVGETDKSLTCDGNNINNNGDHLAEEVDSRHMANNNESATSASVSAAVAPTRRNPIRHVSLAATDQISNVLYGDEVPPLAAEFAAYLACHDEPSDHEDVDRGEEQPKQREANQDGTDDSVQAACMNDFEDLDTAFIWHDRRLNDDLLGHDPDWVADEIDELQFELDIYYDKCDAARDPEEAEQEDAEQLARVHAIGKRLNSKSERCIGLTEHSLRKQMELVELRLGLPRWTSTSADDGVHCFGDFVILHAAAAKQASQDASAAKRVAKRAIKQNAQQSSSKTPAPKVKKSGTNRAAATPKRAPAAVKRSAKRAASQRRMDNYEEEHDDDDDDDDFAAYVQDTMTGNGVAGRPSAAMRLLRSGRSTAAAASSRADAKRPRRAAARTMRK